MRRGKWVCSRNGEGDIILRSETVTSHIGEKKYEVGGKVFDEEAMKSGIDEG